MLNPAERSEESISVRQLLERRQQIVLAVACVVIVGAIVSIYAQVRATAHPNVNMTYYSDDDGKTWFEGPTFEITPFDHEGREAVGAMVYVANGRKYVGYLTRFSKRGAEIFQRLQSKAAGGAISASILAPLFADVSLQEVKLAGPGNPWVNMRSREARPIVTPPNSPSGDVEIADP
jgi:hypothetical protein